MNIIYGLLGGNSNKAVPFLIDGNSKALSVRQISPTQSWRNSAAGTNATSVTASSAVLKALIISNHGSENVFLKLFNKNAAPVLGTDIPVMTIVVPANAHIAPAFGNSGHLFSAGIAYAITLAEADTDATAITLTGKVKLGFAYNN